VTWVELLRAVGAGAAFVMPALFCVCYHVWTGGHWRDSRYGAHLMVFSAGCALILLYSFLAVVNVIPQEWRPYFSLVIYPTVFALFLWRLLLLRSDHRASREGKNHAAE
jgi:hypothetical protein